MVNHLSLRLAWHSDGWNGHICKNPSANTYCIGRSSYPGDFIKEHRDLNNEIKSAGLPCNELDFKPPCSYSINAFGSQSMEAWANPPVWFKDSSKGVPIELPP